MKIQQVVDIINQQKLEDSGNKLGFVKTLTELTGCGLRYAKDMADYYFHMDSPGNSIINHMKKQIEPVFGDERTIWANIKLHIKQLKQWSKQD